MTEPFPDALIVLTGGRGRRCGNVDKAAIVLGGVTLLELAIASARGRQVVIAGGHHSPLHSVISVAEDPVGGGPAAGIAAAGRTLALDASAGRRRNVSGSADQAMLVALMAVDHAGVTSDTWARLAAEVVATGGDGAALVAGDRVQYAVAVLRMAALLRAVAQRTSWHGAALRTLVGPLIATTIPATAWEADDIDTPDAWTRWLQRYEGGAAVPRWSGNDDQGARENP